MRIIDIPLLFLMLAVGSISTLVIFSINHTLGLTQLAYWVLGLVILVVTVSIQSEFWIKISLYFYLFTLFLLVLLFFVAEPVRGSTRWIDFGFFRLQPSELVKISGILVLANYFKERSASSLKNIFYSLIIILPAGLLVFFQPDLGNAASIMVIWLGITVAAGMKLKHMLLLLLAFIIFTFTAYEMLAPYQKQRITTFINPAVDPLGTGYNIIQSQIAAGSGRFFGRGLGRGPQSQLNFLPEAESDFIFASITEQLGFLGALLLIIFHSLITYKLINSIKSASRFGALFIIGTVTFLMFQFLVNTGMNIGVVPVTGITLPLVSYGGSSLISTIILIAISQSQKDYKSRSIRYYTFS